MHRRARDQREHFNHMLFCTHVVGQVSPRTQKKEGDFAPRDVTTPWITHQTYGPAPGPPLRARRPSPPHT